MATVYLAQDLRHHRKVALKVLRPDLAASMGAERFLREIGVAAALHHPHILPLYDSGQAGDTLFYVMPYVEGASLRERLQREGALPVADAVRLLREVADALAEAHRHRVVHRDIKPENIMLSGRHALVADFGVAKAVSEATDAHALTSVGVAIGTPAYMAPEQATADPATDHRADLYALGVLGYELLAGRPPFQHATAQGLIAAHVTSTPEAVQSHRPAVPPALAAVIMRCLEKRAADRYQSAEEVVAALEALPVSGATTPATTAVPARARPRRPALLAAALMVPVLAAVAWFATRPAAVALDTNLVLALPFRVTATAPEIQNLREGVVDILQASLGGSVGPRVVAAQTAIGAWRRAGGSSDTDLSDADATTLARELGAGSVLTGSIVQQGAGFVMSGTLTPVGGGRALQGRVEGAVDSTLALVGRLVGQLLSLRAGEESGRASSLAGVPLPALQAYLDGQRAWRGGRWAEALDGFGRAIAADSTFPLAGLYHSLAAGWNLGGPPSPGPDIARANLHRLSDRDRILASVILNLPGDSTVADRIAHREQAAAALADRAEAWYLLGDYIYHYGQLAGMSWPEQVERAWAAFNRGLELDPEFGPILTHSVDRYLFPEVDSLAFRRAQAAHSVVGQEPFLRGLAAYAFRDTAEIRWLEETADAAQLFGVAGFAAMFGDNDGGLRLLRLRVQRATSAQERSSSLEQGRDLAWSGGRPQLAARLAQDLGVQPGPPNPDEHGKQIIAALFYDADPVGAASSAAAMEDVVRATGTGTPAFEAVYAAWHAGLWRASEGNTTRAAELARQLRQWADRGPTAGVRSSARVGAQLVEMVATADPLERGRRALALDDHLRSGPVITPTPTSLANLLVARALGDAGEHARAADAARRVSQFDALLPASLALERGRQALLAADTATAVLEWQLYLRARAQAEPAQRAKDDRIREELARLVGERGGR